MAQGERGHIAYKKETNWGTVAGSATKVWTMNDEAIIQNIEEILSKSSRGKLDEPHSYQGLKTFGGPISLEIHPANFGDILRSAIWKPSTNDAASIIRTLRACEYNWMAHTSCLCEKDTTDYKEGSASVKIYIPEGVGTGVKVATKDFQITRDDISFHENAGAEDTIVTVAGDFLSAGFAVGDSIVVTDSTFNNATFTILAVTAKIINLIDAALIEEEAGDDVIISKIIDMTADEQIKLWIKCSIATNLGQLKFMLAPDAACATPDEEIEIDALIANTWKEVTLTIGTPGALVDVLSMGLETAGADLDECIVWIDDIRRIDTAGAAGTAKDHVFTPSQDDFPDAVDGVKRCPLYPYTIEVHRDQAEDKAWQFLGSVINTLNLKFGVDDKILTAVAGILAQNVDRVVKTAIPFPTTKPFTWDQAKIFIGGVVDPDDVTNVLESVEINIDNKLVGVPSLNNDSIIRRFYRSGPREITVNFVTDFVDQVEQGIFIAGTEQVLQIIFTGAVTPEAGYYYTLTIYMPKFRYLTYPITNPGSGRISVGVTGKAKYCEDVDYAIRFTLRNYTAEY